MKKNLFFALMGLLLMGSFTSCKKTPTVPEDLFCITALENNVQVSMEAFSPDEPYAQVSLLYSLDGIHWNDFIACQTAVTLANAGDKMYVKANNVNTGFYKELSDSTANYLSFKFSHSAAVGGNIMYLLNGENPAQAEMGDGAFAYFFYKSGLTDASALILPSKLSERCFFCMFTGCTQLMKTPQLTATKLADGCYWCMFSKCSSLREAPELPATELAESCYQQMFDGCTSLQVAPELPATTLADACYDYMFRECTSLRATPELPALTVGYYCYQSMFADCTSLTYVAPIHATQLGAYSLARMFKNCVSLVNGPTLLASTLAERSYLRMFQGCTSLTSVTCKATDMSAERCLYHWMDSVTTTGVLHAAPGTDWTGNIPDTWTVVYE